MPDDRSSVDVTWRRADSARPAGATGRLPFRRALALMLMTVVMPGSAQLVAGDRRIGRICVRIWLGFLAATLFVLVVAMTSRSGLFGLATDERLLTWVRWILTAGAVAWALLLIDAWRLGGPWQLSRRQRLWMTGVNGTLCFVTAGSLLFAAHLVSVQSSFIGTVFASEEVSAAHHGRYNVLLLGGDSGSDREGMRPDSINLASIDAETGRTVLIGLPRNLEDVPFAKGSVMDREFPDGFTCEEDEHCYLNAVHTWAENNPEKFDSDTPGVEATTSAVEAITGLKVNYYAMINMEGFAHLIDAVGGVTVDVKERTAIGGIGAPITGWVEPGRRKLDGNEALWYSRSRVQNSDFSRMGRQKCVMNAMLHELSPKKVLLNVEDIASSSAALLSTDIPASDLGTFLDLALKARSQPVSTVSLTPPVIYTGSPDYDLVRTLVRDAVAAAEGGTDAPPPLQTARLDIPTFQTAEEQAADTTVANQAEDLSSAC